MARKLNYGTRWRVTDKLINRAKHNG